MPPAQQLTIEQAISQAEKAASQGNISIARQLYNAILQQQPNHPIATRRLRELSKGLSHHQSVQAQIANPSPDQINALVNSYHSGQMTRAEQACRELLQTYPKSLTVLNVFGAVLAGQGQLQPAVQVFDKVIQLKPDYAETYSNRGVALKKLGQLEETVESHQKPIGIQPDLHSTWGN